MSAESIAVITIAFPDPTLSNTNDLFEQVDPRLSFTDPIRSSIRTLSSNDASPGSDITGLLFVPDLTSQACINASSPYVPANATHRINLPHNDYSLIAVAPWFSPECTLEYLATTVNTPTHAFIFFQPQSNSTDMPPLANDLTWSLGDGGNWKKDHDFPVFAVPPFHGNLILSQMNLYSGNVTEVPSGHDLVAAYPASDYIRLWTKISISDTNKLPSLWVFLLITLGLLLLIVGGTSFTMHFLQRKRRQSLQRRIANGEVDLEILGVKRLTVPQEILDKMPLHTYATHHDAQLVPPAPQQEGSSDTNLERRASPSAPAFSQHTCAICLDDFVANETTVRELPCLHIFHPECVDSFLVNNSSLCPMCKHSTLPRGYCPTLITNAMVRRERAIRKARRRAQNRAALQSGFRGAGGRTGISSSRMSVNMSQRGPPPSEHHRLYREALAETILGRSFGRPSPHGQNDPLQSPPPPSYSLSQNDTALRRSDQDVDIEMGQTSPLPVQSQPPATDPTMQSPDTAPDVSHQLATQPPPDDDRRGEWARQRALSMIGRRRSIVDADEEERRRPAWRRAIGKVWPGLA